MLQVSSTQILFPFSPSLPLSTTLTIRNSSPTSHLLFKMKTTAPQLFEVTPSQGSLSPGQTKLISFKSTRIVTREEAGELSVKHKFLIQSTEIGEEERRGKEGDVKGLIGKYNQENKDRVENIRLVMRVEGVTPVTIGQRERSRERDNGPSRVSREPLFETVTGGQPILDVKATPELNRKLQDLQRQEQRLMRQKFQVFNQATKGSQKSQSSLTLGSIPSFNIEIMLFIMLFCIGLGANKVIRRQRIRIQQSVSHPVEEVGREEIVYEKTRGVYDKELGEYEVRIVPGPKRGERREFRVRVGEGMKVEVREVEKQ